MHVVAANTFEEWRLVARALLASAVQPPHVCFREVGPQRELFQATKPKGSEQFAKRQSAQNSTTFRVSKRFLQLAEAVACHRDASRFELLYRTLWRLMHGESRLLDVSTDDDVHKLHEMEKAVRRDCHKMKAFVRFRRVEADGREQFIAWHRPDHRIVRRVAPFFSRRFPTMEWTILTPDDSVHWNEQELTYGPGVPASNAPQADELEAMWKTYYASIFNPARIKLKTMKREMPVRHWKTLPETAIIPEMLLDAPRRVEKMVAIPPGGYRSATQFVPESQDYESLRDAAGRCQGCELYCDATQTVFGEGSATAQIMMVGEQPGDMEDREGRPFVGPAGAVFDDAMRQAGIKRDAVYLTNAVKHFKFILRGKRRIHNKPSIQEAIACRPWLEAEIELVRPKILVCLGATAAQSLMGTDFRITRDRGRFFETTWCPATIATYHPSAVLRAQDKLHSAQIMDDLIGDLRAAQQYLTQIS